MGIYGEILLVSAVTVYIVDLSGFTESWRSALARWLKISPSAMRPLHPFDCGQCMSWWVCLIYALCCERFSLGIVAWSAFLAFMSTVTGQLLQLIREIMTFLINRIYERL